VSRSEPAVSVILPVYNAESSVAGALAMALQQDRGDLEVIAVDDASTDLSPLLLRRYAQRDSRVRLLTQDRNLGVVPARNRAIAQARGEWLAFLDADDAWLPQKLRLQLRFADALAPEGTRRLGIGTRAAYFGRRGGPIGTIGTVGDVTDSLHEAGPLPFCLSSLLVRRAAVVDAGGFDPTFNRIGGQDYDLMVRLARDGVEFHAMPERLTWYRLHQGSISAQYHGQQLWTSRFIADRTRSLDNNEPLPELAAYLVEDPSGVDDEVQVKLREAAIELLDGSPVRSVRLVVSALARNPSYVAGKLSNRLLPTPRGRGFGSKLGLR